jgi:hypothetical protein
MKQTILFFLLFTSAVLLFGCGSNADIDKTANVTANPNAGNSNVVGVPNTGRPVMQYETAAEDSQIAQATNSGGQPYEVRIWKKHPQLLKVESIGVDEKNKALTIITRDAKIYKVTTDRIPNIKLATAAQFLEVGNVPPSVATPRAKTEGNTSRRFQPEAQQAE